MRSVRLYLSIQDVRYFVDEYCQPILKVSLRRAESEGKGSRKRRIMQRPLKIPGIIIRLANRLF